MKHGALSDCGPVRVARSGSYTANQAQPRAGLALLVWLGLSAFAAAAVGAQAPDQPLLRWQYFYEQRAYPFDSIPPGALQRAYRQMTTRWPDVIARNAPNDALAAAATWSELGPAPIDLGWSGRISTIAIDPVDRQTLYIGGAQGGVWKSTNAGTTWTPLTDTQCSLAMGSIVIDPVDPRIVYAGTGELHFSGDSYYGCGVLRSTDAGASWTHQGASVFDTNTGGARVSRLLLDPRTAGSTATTTVHASTSFGVFRSRDSGLNWTRVLEGTATDLAMDRSNPATLYAAIGTPGGSSLNGVYRSDDGGSSWSRLAGGFPTTDVGRISLAIAPSSPTTIYAAVQDAFGGGGNDGMLLGIWKTTDGGAVWNRLPATAAECGTQCWYDLVLAVDPRDPNTVFFGGVLLYLSEDGGNFFRNVTRAIHVDQHAIEFDPQDPTTMYVGNDGGIYVTSNRALTFTSLNTNLSITQFYSGIALHPTNPDLVLGGTQDNGTLEFGGVPTWSLVLGGDGGYTAIDHQNPEIAWAETQWTQNSGFSGPRMRIGPGPFGDRKVLGIDLADRALFIPPLVMDPTNAATLYFGTFRVYRTTNRGDFWTAISGDLTLGTGRVSAIAPSQVDPATIFAGTSDGRLHVSRDGGATWVARNSGLPNRFVTDFATDATDAGIAIATVSGFGTGHVFRTTDFGATWRDISGDLPDVPVNAVLTHPWLGPDIYVGTDLGVFRSLDLGLTWSPFNDGMPNVAVFDLAYRGATGLAVAATHGRGMLSFRPLAASAVVLATDSVRFNSLADTVRLRATAIDTAGQPLPGASFLWRTLDPLVAAVDASGLVSSRGNGETRIIATFAGVADTALIRVEQVAVAVGGLPDSLQLVVGERRGLAARALDARGQLLTNANFGWSSSDPGIATVDGLGTVTATAVGTATVTASIGPLSSSSRLAVEVPSTTAVTASPTPPAGTPSSEAGSRIPLLGIRFRVTGIEDVEITRLGFDVDGDDPDAALLLIRDLDGDGVIGPEEPVLASVAVSLAAGATSAVAMPTPGLRVPPIGSFSVIVALRLSGRSPNGAVFRSTFVPLRTSSRGVRSGAPDRLALPPGPVASAEIRATLLADEELLAFSENPVRATRVVFNFAERPARAVIYTVAGRLVIDLTRRLETDGRVEWDLRNEDGQPVAPGVYLVLFEVRGTVFRERLFVLRPGEPRPDPPAGRAPAGMEPGVLSHRRSPTRPDLAPAGAAPSVRS